MEAAQAISSARAMLSPCRVCPRECGALRLEGRTGRCGIGALARVASAGEHFGEEPVLVGPGGSGTIFFTGCNLQCCFCQNYDISARPDGGVAVTAAQLAQLMLRLARCGCSNINFVSPTHVAPPCLEAIVLARREGLRLPVVYNSGGYDSVEMLKVLDGFIEIYMPDFKYALPEAGLKYSDAPRYPAVARAALTEMYRQVGPLRTDSRGLATRGVLVRHLVMPMDLGGSRQVIDLVAETAPGCAINVMGQYRPCHRAADHPELLTLPSRATVADLRRYAREQGLQGVD